MKKESHGLSARARLFVLLALLVLAPAAMAADPSSEPSLFDIVQQWFESLLGDDDGATEPDGGVIHLPGG